MIRGRSTVSILAATTALALPATAGASAQLLSPALDAVVTSHPTFTWSLPDGETSEAIDVSASPVTAPDGNFADEGIVDTALFSNDELSWTPARGLFAGSYWWMVETFDPGFDILYTPPRPFSVAESGTIAGLTVRPDARLRRLHIAVRWTANTRSAVVVEQVSRAGKAVWTHRDAAKQTAAGAPSTTRAAWQLPTGMRPGTRLVLRVTLKAGALARTVTRPFRAP